MNHELGLETMELMASLIDDKKSMRFEARALANFRARLQRLDPEELPSRLFHLLGAAAKLTELAPGRSANAARQLCELCAAFAGRAKMIAAPSPLARASTPRRAPVFGAAAPQNTIKLAQLKESSRASAATARRPARGAFPGSSGGPRR